MNYYFKIANVIIQIETDIPIDWSKTICTFMIPQPNEIDEYYHISFKDKLWPEGVIIYRDERLIVFRNGKYEDRLYYLFGNTEPYMLYKETDLGKKIYLNKHFYRIFIKSDVYCIFNALAFEKVLIEHNGTILHCSYIVIHNKAILFSGPSLSGKSTQARLWNKYLESDIINSDRAIIQKESNQYVARGIPIDGSSDICKNITSPICAIIFIHPSEQNVIRVLNLNSSTKKLISETTINYFNNDFVNKALNQLLDIARSIPIYESWCTKDQEAVFCIETKLKEDGLL